MTKNNAATSLGEEPTERTVVSHNNIGEAFLAIMNEVGYVQKKGVNTAQKYKYAGEAQLIEALRPALMKHKVICVPGAVEIIDTGSIVTGAVGGEKKTYRVVAKYTWVYTHVPSNTHMQIEVIGEGVDTGDKSAYKAATGALKYALRQPFLIETGDEPEAHDLPNEAKVKGVFSSNAKRNDWTDKLTKQLESAPDLGELKSVWDEALPILQELKDSPAEYDQFAYDHMVKIKDLTKASIQKFASE